MRPLYESKPYDEGMLDAGDGHSIAYWQYGAPDGMPAVYLHGGPGAGSMPMMAGFFDPRKYRVLLFDQRGCGKSLPHAELRGNTTWHLVRDMEALRTHLQIERWLVCGGSWGSTLALAYAQTHAARVTHLVLRGIFTLRRSELLWFYQEGASWFFPEAWQEFVAPIPPAERGDMMSAYYRRLTGDDATARAACAAAWSGWEGRTLSLARDEGREAHMTEDKFALAFARIECHYFVNAGFFAEDGQLIKRAELLRDIPATIVQGRYDVVTPIRTAWQLAQAMPHAKFVVAEGSGHAATEPEIAAALMEATDAYAR